MTAEIVVLYPRHSPDCPVLDGSEAMRWCVLRRRPDGRWVADRLGTPVPCLSLPVLDVPARVDRPRGGDAA